MILWLCCLCTVLGSGGTVHIFLLMRRVLGW